MPTIVTLLDGTIPVAADFMTSLNNLNQAIGTGTAITTYTTGDTVYASAANTLAKLPIGSVNQQLAVVAGIPAWAGGSRVLSVNVTGAATTGTVEENLMTYSLPADSLSANNRGVRVTAHFTSAANANNKTARIYFGATIVADSSALGLNNGDIRLTAEVFRTGAATQDAFGVAVFHHAASNAISDIAFTTPAETLSGAVTIKTTGTTPTASGDLTCQLMQVEAIN